MSSTGPMTWTTLPTLCFASSAGCFGACFAFVALPYPFRAYAPPTISDSRCVICACRARVYVLCRRSMVVAGYSVGFCAAVRLVAGAASSVSSCAQDVADPLLRDRGQVSPRALALELLVAPPLLADQFGVDRAAQPPVGGDDHERDPAALPPGLAQQGKPLRQLRCVQVADHLGQGGRVRPRRDDPVLGALQLRRGHELHRPRDLARALDRLDAATQLAGLGHQCAASCLYSATAARSRAVRSSPSTRRVRISSPTSGCGAAMKSRNPCSHARISGTGTSSR